MRRLRKGLFGLGIALMIVHTSVVADPTPGTIETVVGNGTIGYSGDGGAATAAALNQPNGIAMDVDGNLLFADAYNHVVRKVEPNGTISTVAGNGSRGFTGDGGLATTAQLEYPRGIAVDSARNIYFSNPDGSGNGGIRKVAPDGIITTFAGNTGRGFWGDGGPATSASLNQAWGLAVDGAGNLLIADSGNNRIRRVASDGTITTVAGGGIPGILGDGGPATSASLASPLGIAVDGAGSLLIADRNNHRIRKVAPNGLITTVAGTGTAGSEGDNGPATEANLRFPLGVVVDSAGNIFIAGDDDARIRRVAPDGTITTVAGDGTPVCGVTELLPLRGHSQG